MRTTSKNAHGRYHSKVHQCPPPGNGVHSWIMAVSNYAAMADMPMADADRDIRQNMTRLPSPQSEVEDALIKAYAELKHGGGYRKPKKSAKPLYGHHTASAFIERGMGWDEAEWLHASPVRIAAKPGVSDALALLEALYASTEYTFCGERYGAEVRTAAEWIDRFKNGVSLPPHWIPNPLTGRKHPLPSGKLSSRGDSAVAAFRFAVCEFDCLSRSDQLCFWAGFTAAPIAALVDSAGKSIHAILRVDAPDRESWEHDIEQKLFAQVMVPLGCDPACRNESRLSRMPGHFRREKNQWQRLLYLNPEGTPRR